MSCKKCKKICKLCIHFIDKNGLSEPECDANKHEEMDCVTGDMRMIYSFCSTINKDGNCPSYKENKELAVKFKLIELLEERRKIFVYHRSSNSIEEMLIRNLLEILKGNDETHDFWIEYDDEDYDYGYIRSKWIERKHKEYAFGL